MHVGRSPYPRNPDYIPVVVGNTILGGGTSSRLFNRIREKEGFAYSVYSHQTPMKDAGVFGAVMQVRNEVVGPAVTMMLSELNAHGQGAGVGYRAQQREELSEQVFVLRLQTQDGLAGQLTTTKTMGLPVDTTWRNIQRGSAR